MKERIKLEAIEDDVVQFFKVSLASECRPIWAKVDNRGDSVIRLFVADHKPSQIFECATGEIDQLFSRAFMKRLNVSKLQ